MAKLAEQVRRGPRSLLTRRAPAIERERSRFDSGCAPRARARSLPPLSARPPTITPPHPDTQAERYDEMVDSMKQVRPRKRGGTSN
jgi:hypothetical protein